jgi:Transglycosylase SLT domain
VIDSAFVGLTQDGSVLAFDRRQRGTFRKSFEEYAATRVVPARVNRARQLMQRHAALLARIERQFGVPATLLMAIWTLESDNGSGDMGKLPVIRTLATLAHDCRRTELFQGELLAALQIVQRGDLTLRELIGAYAGEIGQTQFLPSSYIKYGVDYDGINLQERCHDLIHMDLPWNPARLEQRNGRIDRKLQPSSKVWCRYFVYVQREEDVVLQALVRKTELIRTQLGSAGQVIGHRLLDRLEREGITRAKYLANEIDEAGDEELQKTAVAEMDDETEARRARQAKERRLARDSGALPREGRC